MLLRSYFIELCLFDTRGGARSEPSLWSLVENRTRLQQNGNIAMAF